MRKSYEDVIKTIERNARDILSSEVGERGIKRAEGCLLAILCELLLDIRESLTTGTIVPSCEVVDE